MRDLEAAAMWVVSAWGCGVGWDGMGEVGAAVAALKAAVVARRRAGAEFRRAVVGDLRGVAEDGAVVRRDPARWYAELKELGYLLRRAQSRMVFTSWTSAWWRRMDDLGARQAGRLYEAGQALLPF